MQGTPRSGRLHIGIFGRRNAGKSSLINALANQELAVVSSVPGTTTDPVFKAMELLPIGPVVLIDAAGLDDTGILGDLRTAKSMEILRKTDLAVMVADGRDVPGEFEDNILKKLVAGEIPVVGVVSKADLAGDAGDLGDKISWYTSRGVPAAAVSAASGQGLEELKGLLIKHNPGQEKAGPIIRDLINPGDVVVLVVPIDSAAPKGDLAVLTAGVSRVKELQPGDRVLVAEGCTHHRQPDDIGKVKIPRWLDAHVGGPLDYTWTSGYGFPSDLATYRLVIHCGGCMLNRREIQFRIREVAASGVPVVNYGVLIAHLHGILERVLEPFSQVRELTGSADAFRIREE